MCECIRFDANHSSNANNNYNEKVVSQLNSLTDKHLLCSSQPESCDSANERKWCEKCICSSLSSMVPNVSENSPKCKGIVVSIDSIESPTIDAVLDKVPLVYDPITKQLLLHNTHSNHNKSINGVKNGFNVQNGLNRNGLLNLKIDNNCSNESNVHLRDSKDYLNSNNDNNCTFDANDNSFEDKQNVLTKNNTLVECTHTEQSADNLLNRTESLFKDNDLSVLDSIKVYSLEDEDEYTLCTNQDNISQDESISSLNLDDCESNAGSVDLKKPKKLFTLSLQSFLSKVKRNSSNTTINSNNSNIILNKKNGAVKGVNITSTTALILENRPPNLPAKPEDEEKKHKLEFEEMIRQSRKKELKQMKLKKKLIQKQHKQEEQVIEAIKQWTNDILTDWDKMKSNKKTRDLWWSGIPSLVRQKVWILAINNELNITTELYEICVNRSKEKVWTKNSANAESDGMVDYCGESAADLIKLDVSRTFPQLGLFQESGPYHEMLSEVLGAYVTYRPDIGYSQGMSFLAAMLLLNMESAQAFICFANLLNSQLLLSFFRVNQTVMNAYYQTYEELFRDNLPKLYKHFNEHNLTPDLYLVDYIYTLFSRSLPLDVASRVWDLFLRDGDQFIFRAALGILAMYYDVLLNLDFIYLAQFLTKLPDDIDADKLFSHISSIRMTIGSEKMTFSSVLSSKLLNSNT